MWSDQIAHWTEAVLFCLLVITVELCHGIDFIFSWVSYGEKKKKYGYLNNLGKVSHPLKVCLPNLLKCSLPLTFLFILAHK